MLLVHKYDNEKNEMYDYDKLEEELNKYEHIDYLYNVICFALRIFVTS